MAASSTYPPICITQARTAAGVIAKESFQQHIHVFRGLAIILIVSAHTVSSLNWSSHPLLGGFIDALANQASIFFFFIAGYLFQHLSARFTYGRYLSQKLKTVILPYLILSIPALVIYTAYLRHAGMWPWFYSLPRWQQIGLFLLTGKHLAPLWFVPTIALFYLAAPLLLMIDRRAPWAYWSILPLCMLSTYIGRGHYVNPFGPALYLLPIYLLGMLFSRNPGNAESWVSKGWLPLAILTTIGFFGHMLAWPEPPYYFMLSKMPATLLLVVALRRWHLVFGKSLDYIAQVSFGIFFVHAYITSAFRMATMYLLNHRVYIGEFVDDLPGNLPVFIAYNMSVLLLSVGMLWLAQKVLGKRSRMIVGA